MDKSPTKETKEATNPCPSNSECGQNQIDSLSVSVDGPKDENAPEKNESPTGLQQQTAAISSETAVDNVTSNEVFKENPLLDIDYEWLLSSLSSDASSAADSIQKSESSTDMDNQCDLDSVEILLGDQVNQLASSSAGAKEDSVEDAEIESRLDKLCRKELKYRCKTQALVRESRSLSFSMEKCKNLMSDLEDSVDNLEELVADLYIETHHDIFGWCAEHNVGKKP